MLSQHNALFQFPFSEDGDATFSTSRVNSMNVESGGTHRSSESWDPKYDERLLPVHRQGSVSGNSASIRLASGSTAVRRDARRQLKVRSTGAWKPSSSTLYVHQPSAPHFKLRIHRHWSILTQLVYIVKRMFGRRIVCSSSSWAAGNLLTNFSTRFPQVCNFITTSPGYFILAGLLNTTYYLEKWRRTNYCRPQRDHSRVPGSRSVFSLWFFFDFSPSFPQALLSWDTETP